MYPKISVVITAYNDKEKLINCLSSLRKQIYAAERREIIVVDDGSTDGTADILRSTFPEIKVVKKANSGPDNSRAYGIREASSEIVAFIDSDCIASPDWLKNIVCSLRENNASIVGGQIIHEGNFWMRIIGVSDFGGLQSLTKKEANNIPTCNMGVMREIFERFNFNPHLRIGGDVIFCNELKKNGYKLLYDPNIKVIHHPEVNFLSFFGRACRYGETFVCTRRIDPTLPYARFLRFGILGIVVATLARAILDWYRLFRYRRESKIKIYEVVPAMVVLFFKRLISLLGALKATR